MKNKNNVREAFQKIQSVDEILSKIINKENIPDHLLKTKVRELLNSLREDIQNQKIPKSISKYISREVEKIIIDNKSSSLKSVINGTGIILNTGLGRAPISKDIILSVADKIYPYSNLEVDKSTNKRSNRLDHIEPLINSLVGSEKSLMVNNNAAAVMIMLNSLCKNKNVIISRGEQVEIGGSFRIPDIIKSSGCKMVEVGTTNKTKLSDYENAIDNKTSAILVVHTSNYKVVGFTETVDFKQLGKLCKEKGVQLLFDLGSGAIYNSNSTDIPFEREINDYLKFGADIVTYSGDKLLGGIQSGIISGNKKLVEKIYKNPMYRTFRCDKYRISLMEEILRTYNSTTEINSNNLSINLFLRSREELSHLAENILNKVNKNLKKKYDFKIVNTKVEAGSGSLPIEKLKSIAISITSNNISANQISMILRASDTPVFNYINNDVVYIDLKAIPNDQINILIKQINKCL